MQIFGFLGSLLGYVLWGAFYLLKNKRKFRKNIKITDKRHRKKYLNSMKKRA